MVTRRIVLLGLLCLIGWAAQTAAHAADDPLPSWNDGATKQSIIDFVTRVTKEGGPDYVKPEERVATFDNDGTLWIEQPLYNQFVFAVDEVKKQANQLIFISSSTTQLFQKTPISLTLGKDR